MNTGKNSICGDCGEILPEAFVRASNGEDVRF
jgi:hypothetical protein